MQQLVEVTQQINVRSVTDGPTSRIRPDDEVEPDDGMEAGEVSDRDMGDESTLDPTHLRF